MATRGTKQASDTKVTLKKPRRGSKSLAIIETAQEHPDLTMREVGLIHNCSHVNVVKTLERYGINRDDTQQFIDAEKLIRAEKKRILLTSITEDEIKKMSVHNRIVDYGILVDKDREPGTGDNAPKIQVNIVTDPSRVIDVTPS